MTPFTIETINSLFFLKSNSKFVITLSLRAIGIIEKTDGMKMI